MHKVDDTDLLILKLLQENGRMSNVDLSKAIGMSAPPCLRRVKALEKAGLLQGYFANVDGKALGFDVRVFAMVGLHSQAEVDLQAFEAKCAEWDYVRECHMLNGEIDFLLKCVAPDLSSFQNFLTEHLTSAENVANVKTSLVIRCSKDVPGVPISVALPE